MWISTILTTVVHIFLAGMICWAVDEVNSDYTALTFMAYMTCLAALSINNYHNLLAGLIYDRDNTLKVLDESINKE